MSEAGPAPAPVVVTLPAEVDAANAGHVGTQLRAAFSPGITVVVADMTATVFCDSAGVRQLILADDWAAAHAAQLRLAVPPGHVLRVLTLMGLDRLLSIYPSLAVALAG